MGLRPALRLFPIPVYIHASSEVCPATSLFHVGGGLVIAAAIVTFVEKPEALLLVMQSVAYAAALLLLVGLWTPIAGVAIAVLELWTTVSRTNGMENSIPLATLGAALAVLGPGSYSVDAKLFGRKRIQIRN